MRKNLLITALINLLLLCVVSGAAGCRRQAAQPVQQQPVAGTEIVITSPQPGALVDSPLIVRGTAAAAAGNVMLCLIGKDGHQIIPIDTGVIVGENVPSGSFEAVLDFVLPTAADGYLEAYHHSTKDGAEIDKVRLPVKFVTRSTNPLAYSTAYVAKSSALLDQPGGTVIRSDITRGRVVTVLKKREDSKRQGWSMVMIYTYDSPMNFIGWVPDSALTTRTKNLDLNEGRLKADVALWNSPPPAGKSKGYQVKDGTPVMILEKKGDWAHGALPGGDEGWIPIERIEFMGPQIAHQTGN